MSLSKAIIAANNIYKHMEAKNVSEAEVAKCLGLQSFSYMDIAERRIVLTEDDYVKLAFMLGTTVDKIKYNEPFYDDRRWG